MKIVDFDETTLKYPNHPKVKDLVDNEEEYISELKAMLDKILSRKLEATRIQKKWAVEQNKWVEVETLQLFEDMIIAARVLRSQENPDSKEYDKPVAKPKKKKEETLSNETPTDTEENNLEEIPDSDSSDNIKNKSSEQLTLFDFNSDD